VRNSNQKYLAKIKQFDNTDKKEKKKGNPEPGTERLSTGGVGSGKRGLWGNEDSSYEKFFTEGSQ